MSIVKANKNGNITYVATSKEGKNFSYAESRHGKYAKYMAEYSEKNNERLHNWFRTVGDVTFLYYYDKSNNSYEHILIDTEDFERVKVCHWIIRQIKDGEDVYVQNSKNKNMNYVVSLSRFILDAERYSNENRTFVVVKKNNIRDYRKSNLEITTRSMSIKRTNTVYANNSSGVRGVYKSQREDGTVIISAEWVNSEGKSCRKTFSSAKYGESGAMEMAIRTRKEKEKFHGYKQ